MCDHISSGLLRINRETAELISTLECDICSYTLIETNIGPYKANPKLGIPLQTGEEQL